MKLDELIHSVKSLGLGSKIYQDDDYLYIKQDGVVVSKVFLNEEFSINTIGYPGEQGVMCNKDIFNLVVEFALTPVEERNIKN